MSCKSIPRVNFLKSVQNNIIKSKRCPRKQQRSENQSENKNPMKIPYIIPDSAANIVIQFITVATTSSAPIMPTYARHIRASSPFLNPPLAFRAKFNIIFLNPFFEFYIDNFVASFPSAVPWFRTKKAILIATLITF